MGSTIQKLALPLILVAACGGTQAKPESPLVEEGSAVPENCCCKWTPLTSEDGMPAYEVGNRMECGSKQGDCVDDVQCNKTPVVETPTSETPSESE